ncbi:MAG: hypothetical protein AAB840_01205, partial [Patescibacteria group bacterium]
MTIILYWLYSIYKANLLKHELFRVKHLAILHINIPKEEVKQGETPKDFQETLSVSEQFFSSLSSLYEKGVEKKIYNLQHNISFEIISHHGQDNFYCF